MEGSSGQEERAEGKEVVGRVRVQRRAKPGDTGDGDGTGDRQRGKDQGRRVRGVGEKKPERNVTSVASGSAQVSGSFGVPENLEPSGTA